METKPEHVSKEYLGQWVAWNNKGLQIIASAGTFDEAWRQAKESNEGIPLMEKIPRRLTVLS